ncbi:hypothetical protein [Metabacillus sp. RGM 3146]|uniref:hypothetical protein n=1 Tax=Metabacillus sp. RGM 3146 TaxID=3401092 RepID=UPI003B9BA752
MEKGSQHLIRELVNNKTELLNNLVLGSSPSLLSFIDREVTIEWMSPLKKDSYKEYRNNFMELWDDWKAKKTVLDKTWARMGPQWDGIAAVKGKDGRYGLLLIEAKAHVNEMNSAIRARDESKERIIKVLEEVKKYFGSNTELKIWIERYYQLSNRLAYLYLLNEKLGIPTWLVLINFEEDPSYIDTRKETWVNHYREVFSHLDLDFNKPGLSKVVSLLIPANLVLSE